VGHSAGVVIVMLTMFVALPRLPTMSEKPRPVVVAPAVATETISFDDVWSKKTDKLKVVEITERIVPNLNGAPVVVPSVAAPSEPLDKPVVQRRRHVTHDICKRHGMRKVHYGPRWRCRR
jgi:hypothetical protein